MRHLRLLIALMAFFVVPLSSSATDETTLEYKVKAVVLFNFAKYVRWPDKVFLSPADPIQVCIMGENPFGDVFDSPEAPRQAQDRALAVTKLTEAVTGEEAGRCQILFWQEKSEDSAMKLLPALQQHSVLTVADRKSEAAIISFSKVDGKVRFSIRRDAAEALGLGISSQLLKLAILED